MTSTDTSPRARRRVLLVAGALLLAAVPSGCSGGPPPDEPRPVPAGDAGPIVAPPPDEPASLACPEVPQPASITRAELKAFLDMTLGAFIARVRTAPVLEQQGVTRWLGYRIIAIDPAMRCGPFGIREGDIVTSVNGMSIEQPDDCQAAWDSLYEATEITLGLIRGGIESPVTVLVVDEPVAITNDGVTHP